MRTNTMKALLVGMVLFLVGCDVSAPAHDPKSAQLPYGLTAEEFWSEVLSDDDIFHEALFVAALNRQLGGHIVASIVAASEPCGGPPLLSTLCADAAWRLLLSQGELFPDAKQVPSPLDSPDPKLRKRFERAMHVYDYFSSQMLPYPPITSK